MTPAARQSLLRRQQLMIEYVVVLCRPLDCRVSVVAPRPPRRPKRSCAAMVRLKHASYESFYLREVARRVAAPWHARRSGPPASAVACSAGTERLTAVPI